MQLDLQREFRHFPICRRRINSALWINYCRDDNHFSRHSSHTEGQLKEQATFDATNPKKSLLTL